MVVSPNLAKVSNCEAVNFMKDAINVEVQRSRRLARWCPAGYLLVEAEELVFVEGEIR